MITKPILSQLSAYLKATYKTNLKEVVSFVSEVRKNATIESDIDVLIVLEKPFNYYQEVYKIGEFISNICLEYNRLVSCCFTKEEEFKNEDNTFYRNIKKESIKL